MQEQYADETFVHVLPAGQIPHTRHVRGSNFTYISVFPDRLPGRAIIIAGMVSLCELCIPCHVTIYLVSHVNQLVGVALLGVVFWLFKPLS